MDYGKNQRVVNQIYGIVDECLMHKVIDYQVKDLVVHDEGLDRLVMAFGTQLTAQLMPLPVD